LEQCLLTNDKKQQEVRKEKSASSVLKSKIRKSPDIAETNGSSDAGKDEFPSKIKCFIFMTILSFSLGPVLA
jgi:hypothetical protein